MPFGPDLVADDYEVIKEQEIDKLVDAGEIGENQRGRVLCFRWMTAEENADRVRAGVDGPVPDLLRGREERPVDASPISGCAPAPMSTAVDIEPQPTETDRRREVFSRPLDLPDLGII